MIKGTISMVLTAAPTSHADLRGRGVVVLHGSADCAGRQVQVIANVFHASLRCRFDDAKPGDLVHLYGDIQPSAEHPGALLVATRDVLMPAASDEADEAS
jgi:hypothetical protein